MPLTVGIRGCHLCQTNAPRRRKVPIGAATNCWKIGLGPKTARGDAISERSARPASRCRVGLQSRTGAHAPPRAAPWRIVRTADLRKREFRAADRRYPPHRITARVAGPIRKCWARSRFRVRAGRPVLGIGKVADLRRLQRNSCLLVPIVWDPACRRAVREQQTRGGPDEDVHLLFMAAQMKMFICCSLRPCLSRASARLLISGAGSGRSDTDRSAHMHRATLR